MMTSTVETQNISIEGAYDEAIEDAASRIYEASRPQRTIASDSSDSSIDSHSTNCVGIIPNITVIVPDGKNGLALSSTLTKSDDNSGEIYALRGDNSVCTTKSDNQTYDDDIESNILFLEEKKQILKKAKVQNENERAYVAVNAYDISNRREPSSRRTKSSSIWSEARKIVEKLKLSGEIGSHSEEDEGNSQGSIYSAFGGVEGQGNTSTQSEPDICPPASTASSFSSYTCQNGAYSTRKRTIIDISTVKKVTSTEFTKYCKTKEIDRTRSADECNHGNVAEKNVTERKLSLHTAGWQQVREMLLATDSKNWISEAALKQILVLSSTVIYQHQRPTIATGNGE